MSHDDDDVPMTLELKLVGNRRSVENVRVLLGFLEACARLGTTQRVELLVDGDGDFRFALERSGEPVRLSDDETTFLFAEPEEAPPPPACPRTPGRRAAPTCGRRGGADAGARLRPVENTRPGRSSPSTLCYRPVPS